MAAHTLILIARASHIVGSVLWAGFVMLVGFWFVGPAVDRGPERSRRLRQAIVNRGARVVGPAALLSLASGLYLFRNLHGGGWSRAEFALAFGSFAAVLSFFTGAIGSGPAEKRLAQLDVVATRGDGGTGDAGEIAALERRVRISARGTATLLAASTIAMAVARYL